MTPNSVRESTVRYLWLVGIAVVTAASGMSQPTITSVKNAASFDTAIPRGCLISVFGSKLARAPASATLLPLPGKLEDAALLVGDLELPAPLYFVSPTQINAVLPFEALGDTLSLVVTTSEGRSKPFLLMPAVSGPGLFTRDFSGKGPALAFTSNFQVADAVAPGQPIILYATGLGPTDPPVVTGFPGASQEPLNRVINIPEVYAGDYPTPAPVAFAGLAPGMAGVYQINVTPQFLATDRLYLRSSGKLSNIVQLPLQPGQNVTNASGTIQVLYPMPQDMVGWTPHLLAVKFTARMDVGAAAGPFSIAVVTEGMANEVIAVDPANGTFDGLAPVPSIAARHFDFSASPDIVYDLFSCHMTGDGGTIALPFPGNVLPLSRVSPQEVQLLNTLPAPNVDVPRSATGLLKVQGQAKRGTTFVIDDSNNSSLSVFATYVPVRALCAHDEVTRVRLIIDGKQVAFVDVKYTAAGFPFSPEGLLP
jgi:uncharacterized protein (TIGR03437 family)